MQMALSDDSTQTDFLKKTHAKGQQSKFGIEGLYR